MKSKKIIASLLIVAMMLCLLPKRVLATESVRFTITPNVTEAHPGDEITYTVKMSAIQNLYGMKFILDIPEGLTLVEGHPVDGLQTTLNSIKVDFNEETHRFFVGYCNYTSTADTTLMTFKCTVDSNCTGNKSISFIIEDGDIFDTNEDDIPVDYSNLGSTVTVTPAPIPATGIALNKSSMTLEEGSSEKLNATLTPSNSTDSITWESSAPGKATVDSEGNVHAVSAGTATITAETSSGKTASCTVTVTEYVCKHTQKTMVPAAEPTCTLPGNNKYYTCDECGKVFKANGTTETTVAAETIAALGHDFTIPRHDDNQHWNECSRCHTADTKINHTAEGEYVSDNANHWKICGCGVKVGEEPHSAAEAVRENEHDATCTEPGSYDEVVYCSVCNHEMSRTEKTIPAKGHTNGESVRENVHDATCTQAGSYDEVIYCTVCNGEVSRTGKTIPAKGHTNGDAVRENVHDASCTEPGSYDEVIYCTVCNGEVSRVGKTIPAKGHTAGEKVQENIVPASCTQAGSYDEVVYCTECGGELSREPKEIAMLPHDVSGADWSSDETSHWKECGCGTKVDLANHTGKDPVQENIVPASCTEAGSYDEVVYCSVCNHEMSRIEKTISAKGHQNGTPVRENIHDATCTQDGSYDEVIYCTECNGEVSRTEKTIQAKGHKNGEAVRENIHDATCTQDGSYDEVIYCTECNGEVSRTGKTIPAKGHKNGTPVRENVHDATCTEPGSYDEVIYCDNCNEKQSTTPKVIPAKGHTEGAPVRENEIEATVDSEGSYDEVIYCTACGEELSRTPKTTPKFVYQIIEGAGSSHEEETSNTITIKCNGKFDKFKGIKIDEAEVAKKNYTAKSGSTIVTLSAEYLNTLTIGEHKIKFIYDDGEVETTFKIAEKNDEETSEEANESNSSNESDSTKENTKGKSKSPQTGDSSNLMLWVIEIAISGILIVTIKRCKEKEKRSRRHH